MKSVIYYEPGKVEVEERETPVAGAGEVVVKVACAGICGTDVTAYRYGGAQVGIFAPGEMHSDGQFGHEMVGTVCEIGEGVEGVAIGDRVFVNPMCCKKMGMLRCDSAGAFSEYVTVEDAAYDYNLLKLDDSMSFADSVLIEPLSVGTHGKNVVNTQPDDNVVVYGAGTIGLCVLSALLNMGVKNPVVVDYAAPRLEYVKEMGGVPFNPSTDGDFAEFLKGHFGKVVSQFMEENVDVDVFIDCECAQSIMSEIIPMAKQGTRISIVAVHKQNANFHMGKMSEREIMIKGSLGYQIPDIQEALNNIKNERTKIRMIATHHFPQDQAKEAFATASDPSTGAIKVIIDME